MDTLQNFEDLYITKMNELVTCCLALVKDAEGKCFK